MPVFGSSDDVVLLITAVVACLLLAAGTVEKRRYRRTLDRTPLRISVNGSRGKSTVTRLLTGALAADGRRCLGKTTGTRPRIILGDGGREEAVHRRPEGPNIGEQRSLMRRAVAERAEAVVAECMAVTPDYQQTFHRELLRPHVLVVTNALDDHLEEMGPTVDDVAEVFAASIPPGGVVVVTPGPHLPTYRRVAAGRDAEVLVADAGAVDDALVARFDHLVLPEHVALVLAVTRHLDIPDEVAARGMLDAPVDPFAARRVPVGDPADPAVFVNAFAANDPESTRRVWEHLGAGNQPVTVVMNCREDRVQRTRVFAESLLPELPIDTLVVMGGATRPVLEAAADGTIRHQQLHDLTGADTDSVMEVLEPSGRRGVILGVGNLHGGAAELIEALEGSAVTVDTAEVGAA